MTQNTDRYRTYVTQTGFGLEALANQQSTKVDFAVLVVGDGELPDSSNPANQTDLINQVRHYPVTIEVDDKDPTIWIARAEIPAEDGGFTIREAGIKVVDENGALYSYSRQPGDYKPVLEEGSSKSYTLRLKFIPGNASVIEAKIDPSVQFATPTDLSHAIKEHEDKTTPHPQYLRKDGSVEMDDGQALLINDKDTDGIRAKSNRAHLLSIASKVIRLGTYFAEHADRVIIETPSFDVLQIFDGNNLSNLFHEHNKPNKNDVGLEKLNNFDITHDCTSSSEILYTSQKALSNLRGLLSSKISHKLLTKDNMSEVNITLNHNTRVVIPNPFGNNTPVLVVVELLINGQWANPGWVWADTSPNSEGTRAHYVENEGIVVQTGRRSVSGASNATGGGHPSGGVLTSLPAGSWRIQVFKVGDFSV